MSAPASLDLERAVVGGLLQCETPEDAQALLGTAGDLEPAHFQDSGCGRAWRIARELVREGRVPDPVTVVERLRTTNGRGNPVSLVGSLLDGMPRVRDLGQWAALIRAREPDPTEDRRRRVLWSLGELAALPMPTWRLYGLLTGITLLWAGPGSFKSFLAIAWALSIATGRPWCGRKVKQGTVLFIVGEGAARAFYNRVLGAAAALGLSPDEVKGLPLYATQGPVQLGRWEGVQAQAFLEDARRVADLIGPIGLVVVDTVSRCVPGEENAQEVMQGFVGVLDELRRVLGCDVVALHHGNADGARERGSSVLGGAVDGNLQLVTGAAADDGSVPLSLYALKLKEAESGHGRPPVARLVAVKTTLVGADGSPLRDEMGLPRTTRIIREADPEDETAEEASDRELLAAIEPEGSSATRLSGVLGRGKGAVLRDLTRLAARGLVRQTGGGKTSRWVRA